MHDLQKSLALASTVGINPVHVSSVNSFNLLNENTQKHLPNLVEITVQKAGATTPRCNKLLAFHYGAIEFCSFCFESMHAWAAPTTRRMLH